MHLPAYRKDTLIIYIYSDWGHILINVDLLQKEFSRSELFSLVFLKYKIRNKSIIVWRKQLCVIFHMFLLKYEEYIVVDRFLVIIIFLFVF